MPSSEVFPYGITFRGDGGIDTFPAVRLFFRYKGGGEVPLFLLIDSGAYISALPRQDADALGISAVENGGTVSVSGVGDTSIRGWRHEIMARLGEETFVLPVIFLDNANTPRILGRLGVFEKFTIIFEEANKRSGFLEFGNQEADAVSKILSKIG